MEPRSHPANSANVAASPGSRILQRDWDSGDPGKNDLGADQMVLREVSCDKDPGADQMVLREVSCDRDPGAATQKQDGVADVLSGVSFSLSSSGRQARKQGETCHGVMVAFVGPEAASSTGLGAGESGKAFVDDDQDTDEVVLEKFAGACNGSGGPLEHGEAEVLQSMKSTEVCNTDRIEQGEVQYRSEQQQLLPQQWSQQQHQYPFIQGEDYPLQQQLQHQHFRQQPLPIGEESQSSSNKMILFGGGCGGCIAVAAANSKATAANNRQLQLAVAAACLAAIPARGGRAAAIAASCPAPAIPAGGGTAAVIAALCLAAAIPAMRGRVAAAAAAAAIAASCLAVAIPVASGKMIFFGGGKGWSRGAATTKATTGLSKAEAAAAAPTGAAATVATAAG